MITQTTTKKYYDKWLYKVTIDVSQYSAALLNFNKFRNRMKEFCENGSYCWSFSKHQQNLLKLHKDAIIELIDFVDMYPKTDWTARTEFDISIFTNDVNMYNAISAKFPILERWEPDLTNPILDTPNVISVKKLPYGKYRFKVFLKPHKILDPAEKQEYIKWMNTQVPRITFSEAIQDWIMYTRWSGDARYILVEDEQTLLMLRMRNQAIIGRIYEHVVT